MQPWGPAQLQACQPSPKTGLGVSLLRQHLAMNPQQHCSSQVLCDIYPLGNNSALHITPEQQPSPHIIQLPELQVYNTPMPSSMSPSSIHLPAPSTAPKAASTRPLPGLQPAAMQPVPHPSLPLCSVEIPSHAMPLVPKVYRVSSSVGICPQSTVPSAMVAALLCHPTALTSAAPRSAQAYADGVPHQEDASPGIFMPADC